MCALLIHYSVNLSTEDNDNKFDLSSAATANSAAGSFSTDPARSRFTAAQSRRVKEHPNGKRKKKMRRRMKSSRKNVDTQEEKKRRQENGDAPNNALSLRHQPDDDDNDNNLTKITLGTYFLILSLFLPPHSIYGVLGPNLSPSTL